MALGPILVVDDGSSCARDIRNRLSVLGYDLISLIDSSEQSLAKTVSDNPGLVLLDFLHEVDVAESSTAARVKKVLQIPMIFVTRLKESTQKHSSTKLKSPGFVLSPLDDLELNAALELAVHSSGTPVSNEKKGPVEKNQLSREKIPTSNAMPRKGEEEAFDVIKEIPTFKELPDSALRAMVRQSQFANVVAGEYIAFEGDEDESSFVVVSGRFAMTRTAASGKELVVELLGPGDFFGLTFAIEEEPAQLSARAQSDSEILWIQTSRVQTALKEYPELYKGFLEYITNCLHASHRLSHGLAHDSVRVRIASLLLSLVLKFARVRKDFNSPIVIDITRQQIADLTGTTPETATRMTRAMHLKGMIDCGSPGIIRILDVDALKRLIETDKY